MLEERKRKRKKKGTSYYSLAVHSHGLCHLFSCSRPQQQCHPSTSRPLSSPPDSTSRVALLRCPQLLSSRSTAVSSIYSCLADLLPSLVRSTDLPNTPVRSLVRSADLRLLGLHSLPTTYRSLPVRSLLTAVRSQFVAVCSLLTAIRCQFVAICCRSTASSPQLLAAVPHPFGHRHYHSRFVCCTGDNRKILKDKFA